MDEDLRAIQADLDDVLDRLANYMESDKLSTKLDGAHVGKQSVSHKDAASVVFTYSGNVLSGVLGTRKSLAHAIHHFRWSRAMMAKREKAHREDHGEKTGKTLSAIAALSCPMVMPDHRHLLILQNAAIDFMKGRSKWFGESQNLPLVRQRKIREGELAKPPLIIDGYIKREQGVRMRAAQDIFWESRKHERPLDDSLFEAVAEKHGIKPTVLKEAHYSQEGKITRQAIELGLGLSGGLDESTSDAVSSIQLAMVNESKPLDDALFEEVSQHFQMDREDLKTAFHSRAGERIRHLINLAITLQ